jgi:hypothetical protein
MARIEMGSVGRTVALGLLLGTFTLGVAACDAGYEPEEVEEGVGEEGAIGEEGIGEEGIGEEGIGEEGIGEEGDIEED